MEDVRTAKPKERRTNIDRSASTRRVILEATIRCLQELGYGAVTNIRVAEAAGVSRGAMMHHFPTRQALLVATVAYAYEKLRDYRIARLQGLPPGLPRYRALIDLSWETAQRPEGIATNEIRIGSRSDPEISAAIGPIMAQVADDYARFVGQLVHECGLTPDAEVHGLTATTAMVMRSLAVNRFTYPRDIVDSVLDTLKLTRETIIARQLAGKPSGKADGAGVKKPAKPAARRTRAAT